jgi:segregation and condensation protein B
MQMENNMETIDSNELRELAASVEALLFAAGEPVAFDRICQALGVEKNTAVRALQQLADYYAYERRGIRLVRMDEEYQLVSAPEYGELIRRAFEIRKPAKLSRPALEVLTIVAYYQPTTRAYIDQLRGVDSAYTVSLLLQKGLIEESGHLQVPGRPRLYRTTKEFLRAFHLSSLDELPEMPTLEVGGQLRLGENGEVLTPEDVEDEMDGMPLEELTGAMDSDDTDLDEVQAPPEA